MGDAGSGRYGSSKFGGARKSKFGGSTSTSKFNTGGGFGATALKKIDNGTPRMTYGRNSRFGSFMDDNKRNENDNNSTKLQAPSKVESSRFKNIENNKISSTPSEQTAFPGLSNGNIQKKRKEKTVEELQQEIKRENAKNAMLQSNDIKDKEKEKKKEKKKDKKDKKRE